MTPPQPAAGMAYLTVDDLKAVTKKPRKYHNTPCELDGYKFDSRKEMRRYMKLKLAQDGGVISDLEVHPLYRLTVVGVEVEVFRYTPDFRYKQDGRLVVEDVKPDPPKRKPGEKAKRNPTKTEAYGMRKRLMRALHGIQVVEV